MKSLNSAKKQVDGKKFNVPGAVFLAGKSMAVSGAQSPNPTQSAMSTTTKRMPFGHHFGIKGPQQQPQGAGGPGMLSEKKTGGQGGRGRGGGMGLGPMNMNDFVEAHKTLIGQVEDFERHGIEAEKRIKTKQDVKNNL